MNYCRYQTFFIRRLVHGILAVTVSFSVLWKRVEFLTGCDGREHLKIPIQPWGWRLLHPISNTAKTVGELTHSVECLKETDVISFKYFREIRDVVEVFFATYTCCAEGQREVICPFSFRTRFSRVTLLFATMSTKEHQYLFRGGGRGEGCDWLVGLDF
jgi:hypothetical protein